METTKKVLLKANRSGSLIITMETGLLMTKDQIILVFKDCFNKIIIYNNKSAT